MARKINYKFKTFNGCTEGSLILSKEQEQGIKDGETILGYIEEELGLEVTYTETDFPIYEELKNKIHRIYAELKWAVGKNVADEIITEVLDEDG